MHQGQGLSSEVHTESGWFLQDYFAYAESNQIHAKEEGGI